MKKFFTSLIFTFLILISFNAFSVPKLSSLPNAVATIFLDFDGHYVVSSSWNYGNPINCAASTMTDAQITEAFNRVAEDYRPFNINITTDSTYFLAAPLNMRMRVIITPTSTWADAGISGVALIGSFTEGDDTPAFVFSNRLSDSPKQVAEAISHESGHTVGLAHQSKYDGVNCDSPIEIYNTGAGTGATAWAPIMGNSLNRNFTTWNDGPTPYGCTIVQDNLSTITTQNGFGYRPDDYNETLDAGTFSLTGNNFSVSGIISTSIDKDAFKFTVPANLNFHLSAVPFSILDNWIGANLDIKVELFNSSAVLIGTYDPLTILSVTIDTVLNAGTYYIKIHGAGNSNTGPYGSLGSYTINGSFGGGLPIHNVTLNGTVANNKHNLSWSIVADEPIKNIEVESSNDGSNFAALTTVAPSSKQFSYQPYKNNTQFYRLKVTSILNQTVYSNTIALKGTEKNDKIFSVSTFVQNEIVINAAENYQYVFYDVNGRVMNTGTGLKGINRVNIANQSSGMYIIQLFSNNQKQTERIIKQ